MSAMGACAGCGKTGPYKQVTEHVTFECRKWAERHHADPDDEYLDPAVEWERRQREEPDPEPETAVLEPVPEPDPAELDEDEEAALARCEAVVARGLATFVEVGTALAEIRDRRLYRLRFATFEEYCGEQWALGRRRAYQLMDAAGVVCTIVHKVAPTLGVLPANEGQARELGKVPEPDRVRVWQRAVDDSGGKPTAAAVKKAAARTAPKTIVVTKLADPFAGLEDGLEDGQEPAPAASAQERAESPAEPHVCVCAACGHQHERKSQ